MKGFLRNVAGRSIACFVKNMGAHIPPTILWTAGSMIPTELQRRTSLGRNPMEPLMDLRNLLEEEVAMCNYPLKSTNLQSPARKWNMLSTRRSVSIKTATVMIQTHPEKMGWVLLGIYMLDLTVINQKLSTIWVRLKLPTCNADYEKTDLQSVDSTNCSHLSLQDQNKLLELLTELEELFGNGIPRVYHHAGWNKTPTKEGTSDSCHHTTKTSERPP